MTGLAQAAIALMHAWNSRMCARSARAVRAESTDVAPERLPALAAWRVVR
jgi:hypothetical protein